MSMTVRVLVMPALAVALSMLSLLSGCAGTTKPSAARYDLSPVETTEAPLPLAVVDVGAVSWLGSTDMHYRLVYADPQRRLSYTEARWAAPPAELLGQVLRRQVSGTGSCRLRVMLDELEQRFENAERSVVSLEIRAQLLPARGESPLDQHAFVVREAVIPQGDNPGARAGAAASKRAVERLSVELGEWLHGVPATTLQRC